MRIAVNWLNADWNILFAKEPQFPKVHHRGRRRTCSSDIAIICRVRNPIFMLGTKPRRRMHCNYVTRARHGACSWNHRMIPMAFATKGPCAVASHQT